MPNILPFKDKENKHGVYRGKETNSRNHKKTQNFVILVEKTKDKTYHKVRDHASLYR